MDYFIPITGGQLTNNRVPEPASKRAEAQDALRNLKAVATKYDLKTTEGQFIQSRIDLLERLLRIEF